MAYTQAPQTSTYSTERIPAAYNIDLRPNGSVFLGGDITQDAGMVNLLPYKIKNGLTNQEEIQAVTRQPIHAYAVTNTAVVNRGAYVWEKSVGTTYFFSVNGTGVYTSTNGTTWTLVDTLLTNATTPVRFTEFIDSTNVKKLILVDGVEGYVYTTNAAGTKITDVDFPSPHVPFPVFLDGYLFLAKAGTGDIYNSNLNDPALWTAGDFISSELYPDDVQALVKVNNYLLAIGTQGSEYFYDAANATGSPLARYEGGSLPFGTQIPNSIASNKNMVVFVANNNDGENTIKVIEDFKYKDINPSFLIVALNRAINGIFASTTAEAVRGYFFRQDGKLFYGIAFRGNNTSGAIKSFMYSFDTGWWVELSYGSIAFPVFFTTLSRSQEIGTYVSGHTVQTPFFGLMESTAKVPFSAIAVDKIVNGLVSDQNINVLVRTPNLDFGTYNNKTISRFGLDLSFSTYPGDPAVGTQLNISWSDNDYGSFTSAVTLDASPARNFPFITQLGSFRRRAFRISYSGDYFLRLKSIEVDINKGQQ